VSYLHWLIGITLAFVVLERLVPWRKGQPLLRPGWVRDLLGASPRAVFWVAVFSTFWGDQNHANLNVGLGPLGCVFNSPRMHLWHHDASDEGGIAKNYGIVLSLWDFVFRTAYWPRERSPERLGYAGDATMPEGFLGEIAWPLTHQRA
jgi:sterol desaturase/sphingolipid hydroxylase (fatty acid hydroxylase superfamily)